jgi:transportin-1
LQYQRKAQRSLYEVMSTLANSTGQDLADPSLAGVLVPPVVAKWFALPTDDLEQLAVLDCITEIIPALGDSCQTYAPPLFNRCVVMLRQQLHNRQAQGSEGAPEYEPALLAAALSAASALAEALAASIESLAVQSQLLDLVLLACGDPDASVRQCAFGLLGDLAKSCPSHVLPSVQRCLEACGAVLVAEQHGSEADMRAATNACWAMGELVVRAPAQDLEERFALPLTQVLAQVLSTRSAAGKGMLENAAITLGRLAMRCPQVLAPHAPGFTEHLCTALRRVRDDVEKEQAFAGLCAVVRLNPMGVLPAFVPMANAFASWHLLRDEDLHRRMAEIMRGYKVRASATRIGPAPRLTSHRPVVHAQAHLPPDQWASAWGALETPVQTKLTQWFLQ